MEKRKLYNQLKKVNDEKLLRFHMPGHKGRGSVLKAFDYTEIPGTDNLHHPEGIIQSVQAKLAVVYGSEEARILVGGTTNGLQSAIMGSCREGDQLLIPTNCHRSVFAGLALGRIEGIYFAPVCDACVGFGAEVTPEQVKMLLRQYPDVRGMVLVSPTYYGTVSRVREIAKILHQQGKFLIVDEAHGAHLCFSQALPEDAVSAGADVVVQSTHKILGSLTQSSLMHLQGNRVDRERIKYFLTVLQSSSPSYPLMMSVEDAVDDAVEIGASVFDSIAAAWDQAYANRQQNQALQLYGCPDGSVYDKSKWLFYCQGCQGETVEAMLRRDFKIQCELSGANHVLAMTGIGTTMDDLAALNTAIAVLNHQLPYQKTEIQTGFNPVYETVISMHQAMFNSTTCACPLNESIGQIASSFVIPYPPGIPILLPGSRITEEIVAYLKMLAQNGDQIMGMDSTGNIAVIKE